MINFFFWHLKRTRFANGTLGYLGFRLNDLVSCPLVPVVSLAGGVGVSSQVKSFVVVFEHHTSHSQIQEHL